MLEFLKDEPSLEVLRGLRFDQNNIPDYAEPLCQQLYFLRYFFAYAYEYYDIFSEMMNLLGGEINIVNRVLSIGCGSAFDYWALKRAINPDKLDGYEEEFHYVGIDKVNWLYPSVKEQNDTLDIYNTDFLEWLRENPQVFSKSNIIIFPKSIGEFSERVFSEILSEIDKGDCRLSRKSTVIIGSFRSYEKNHFSDVSRFRKFVDRLMIASNYSVSARKSSPKINEGASKIKISSSKYFPEYPITVQQTITNLFDYCNKYKDNGNKHCEGFLCEEALVFKNPILYTAYMDYEIVILKRG
jgi:hypothetical protein